MWPVTICQFLHHSGHLRKNKLNKSYDILRPFKNFLNLKSLTVLCLTHSKSARVITSYHSYPPKSLGLSPFFQGGNFLGHLEMPSPKPPRPWTMSPSVSLLELVLVQQRVLSPIRHLGSMEGVWGWWYDMIWHACFDTYTVTCYCICNIYIYYILYNLLYMIYVYVYLASFWGKKSWQLTVQWRPRAIRCASQTWPRRKRKGRSSTILFVPEYRIPW